MAFFGTRPDGGANLVNGRRLFTTLIQAQLEIRRRTRTVYLQPINHATVPKGSERFRITATALHTDLMAEQFLSALRSGVCSRANKFADIVAVYEGPDRRY